jgi:pimeloyl-ACP methyl ester carboxylesterase
MQILKRTLGDLELLEFGNSSQSPRVIFLHGGPGMYGYMQTFCEEFSIHCNAVYYEQRGSKQGRFETGIDDHLQDLINIVDHYSSESKPIVVGHSWGAMLAILFAGSHSNMIAKTIAIGSGPLNKIRGKEFQEELISRFGDRREYYDNLWNVIGEEKDENKQRELANDYIEKMMPIYQMDPKSGLEIQPLRWDFKGGFNTMCESDEFVDKNEYENSLRNITSPLTMIQGTHDIISPRIAIHTGSKACLTCEEY